MKSQKILCSHKIWFEVFSCLDNGHRKSSVKEKQAHIQNIINSATDQRHADTLTDALTSLWPHTHTHTWTHGHTHTVFVPTERPNVFGITFKWDWVWMRWTLSVCRRMHPIHTFIWLHIALGSSKVDLVKNPVKDKHTHTYSIQQQNGLWSHYTLHTGIIVYLHWWPHGLDDNSILSFIDFHWNRIVIT